MIENRDLPVGARLALPDSFVPSSAARNGCIRPINGLNSITLSRGAGPLLFREVLRARFPYSDVQRMRQDVKRGDAK